MSEQSLPNRVRACFSANSTDWQIIASDGTGYADYNTMIAAGADPFPGPADMFPTGCPKVVATIDNASEAAGAGFSMVTNSRPTPSLADEFDAGNVAGRMEAEDVTLVWIKKKTGTHRVFLVGSF